MVVLCSGYHEQAGQTCHQDLQAAFSYTISDSENSLTYCGTGNEVWNGLTDTQRLTFDYNACSHPVAYSGEGFEQLKGTCFLFFNAFLYCTTAIQRAAIFFTLIKAGLAINH